MFASNFFDAFQLLHHAQTNPHFRLVIHKNPPLIPPPPAADEAYDEPPSPSPLQTVLHAKQMIPMTTADIHFVTPPPIESYRQIQTQDIHFITPPPIEAFRTIQPHDTYKLTRKESEYSEETPIEQDFSKFEEEKDDPKNSSMVQFGISKNSKKIKKVKPPKLNRKIVKNFGKAIASFACSEKALKIIDKTIKYRNSNQKMFRSFVYEHKECIEGNRRFKQLLTIDQDDTIDVQENKMLFKKMAEIFMKNYVHQWIWNSKLMNKDLHAQLVGEMKKRISNPNLLESLSSD